MSFSIRSCTPADVEVVRRIATESFVDTFGDANTPEDMKAYVARSFNSERLLSELRNPNSFFFIVEDAAEVPLGYLKLNVGDAQTEPMGDGYVEVERIYVLASAKGKGAGSALIEHAYEFAKERGMHSIWLGVWEENHDAIGVYKKHGYRNTGEHSFTLGGDVQTDLVFEKRLE